MSVVDRLRSAYPNLYPPTLEEYMLDVPEGWSGILMRLSERLSDKPIRVHQVKAKFGGLRYYFSGPSDEDTDAAILAAEDESWVTCDACGGPGVLRETTRGWLLVRCDRCGDGATPVGSNRRSNLPVEISGIHAQRAGDVARGFVTLDEIDCGR